jgi:hypothetical protein
MDFKQEEIPSICKGSSSQIDPKNKANIEEIGPKAQNIIKAR